jgi:hypothetical protein
VNGFAADGNMFVQKVQQRLEWYAHAHNKPMPLRAIARLIQTMLYAKRFFPYYVYNILGGIEEDGALSYFRLHSNPCFRFAFSSFYFFLYFWFAWSLSPSPVLTCSFADDVPTGRSWALGCQLRAKHTPRFSRFAFIHSIRRRS